MTEDRLPRLKAQLAKVEGSGSPQRFLGPWSLTDVTWLIGEVERLRGLLRRLEESAAIPTYGDETEAGCPACRRPRLDGHAPDCWLAAEL